MQANRFWSPKSNTYQCLIFLCSPLIQLRLDIYTYNVAHIYRSLFVYFPLPFPFLPLSFFLLPRLFLTYKRNGIFPGINTNNSINKRKRKEIQKEAELFAEWFNLRTVLLPFLSISYRLSILISLIPRRSCAFIAEKKNLKSFGIVHWNAAQRKINRRRIEAHALCVEYIFKFPAQ